MADIGILKGMTDEWFRRLVTAIDDHRDSRRAISLRAGFSDTYIHQMITYEKHPSVSRFLEICRAIEADPVEILTGIKQQSPEVGRALRVFASWSDDQQKRFLDWIEEIPAPTGKTGEEKNPAPADPAGS